MKTKTLAISRTLEGITKFVRDYYLSEKKLIQVSDTEWSIQGNRKGEDYIHKNDRVILEGNRYKHVRDGI
jgi:hypothetical protein